MIVRCDDEHWENVGKILEGAGVEKPCGRVYDDAENSTICPHEPLPSGGVIVYSEGGQVRTELYGRRHIDTRRFLA